MKISLDHDGTYTRDPKFWDEFVKLAHRYGHEVTCVTMRYPSEPIDMRCSVVYTSRKAKGFFYPADVWIDDQPSLIYCDAS